MILQGVGQRYRGRDPVFAGVDLELVPGRPVVVLGENGSGKSALLRIAAGAAVPTAGRVVGRPAVVGYAPPWTRSTSRMRARRWLRHQARLRGGSDADAEPLLDALAGDPDVLDRPLRELSTGNLRKVALASALSGAAPLIVLDEPWNALDDTAAAALDAVLAATAATSALLVADHLGRGRTLPAVTAVRLDAGTLLAETAPVPPPTTVVELRLAGFTAADAVRTLPAVTSWSDRGGLLVVRVPTERSDALLVAAIAEGLSVVRVRPAGAP